MKKQKTKKWRDVKNALVMVVVMAAMMSTATYAWFTFTNSATVTGMQMAAGGASGLKVSLDNQTWHDAVDLREALDAEGNQKYGLTTISQATVDPSTGDNTLGTVGKFASTFYKPVYTGTGNEATVTGVQMLDAQNVDQYVAVYEYYIKAEAADQQVALQFAACPNQYDEEDFGVLDNGTLWKDGSFVCEMVDEVPNYAKYAIRIGIKVDEEMYIWEPNSDGDNAGTGAATDESTYSNGYKASVSSNGNGLIASVDGETTDPAVNTAVSPALFTVGTEGKLVTMYVWLEGTDPDCVNEIKAEKMAAQVQFTTVGTP